MFNDTSREMFVFIYVFNDDKWQLTTTDTNNKLTAEATYLKTEKNSSPVILSQIVLFETCWFGVVRCRMSWGRGLWAGSEGTRRYKVGAIQASVNLTYRPTCSSQGSNPLGRVCVWLRGHRITFSPLLAPQCRLLCQSSSITAAMLRSLLFFSEPVIEFE